MVEALDAALVRAVVLQLVRAIVTQDAVGSVQPHVELPVQRVLIDYSYDNN